MNSQDVLRSAAQIYNDRGKQYGDIEFLFDTAAAMATLMTGREFSRYDITTVMEAVKLARRRVNPANPENYIDNVNYTTFSAQFAKLPPAPINMADAMEDEIKELAKKFAPVRNEEGA